MIDDQDLLLAAGQGNRKAFAALMERHTAFAMSLAIRMIGNADDAAEVVQEAFLRAWRKAASWRPDGGARFTTWLYRVVVNLCRPNQADTPVARVGTLLEQAESRATTASSTLSTLADSLSSRYGVNIDEETARIAELENAYAASAQVLAAVQEMFDALLEAVR